MSDTFVVIDTLDSDIVFAESFDSFSEAESKEYELNRASTSVGLAGSSNIYIYSKGDLYDMWNRQYVGSYDLARINSALQKFDIDRI